MPVSRSQVERETKPFKGTWDSVSTINFGPRPGQPDTVELILQDGKLRGLDVSTPVTWDEANGVGNLGYDEVGSQGNDKWKYFYTVPNSVDDDLLTVIASDNAPSAGPAGYTNWRYIWATYDAGGNLRIVRQTGNRMMYTAQVIALSWSTTWYGSWTDIAIDTCVPLSASEVVIKMVFAHDGSPNGTQKALLIGPEGGGWLLSAYLRVVNDLGNVVGNVPVIGTSSKKISVQNYVWDSVQTHSGQEIGALGWIDEWIDP